jgi:CBS domain containing-hemolysin-like protein
MHRCVMRHPPVLSVLALALTLASGSVRASFLPPELLDTAADWVAIFVLFFVPVVVIAVFWLVHILPEIIAEKRHHPQKATVNTLCLLSLVFGGMLWPLAWILAYTKPVAYRLAYGTDKHDDYFIEKAEAARAGRLSHEEIGYLKRELDEIAEKRVLSVELMKARDELTAALAAGASAQGGAA